MAGTEAQISVSDPASATEAGRLIQLFVHDLRAPLGVATGYLRLLQDGRLGRDVDQGMALSRTLDALGRIATLCDSMAENLPDAGPVESGQLSPQDLLSRVASALKPPLQLAGDASWPSEASIPVGRDGDRFAASVAVLLNAVARRASTARLTATANGPALSLRLTDGDASRAPVLVPFDPWRGFGLEVVLAYRAIQATGGLVLGGNGPNLTIDLPLVQHV